MIKTESGQKELSLLYFKKKVQEIQFLLLWLYKKQVWILEGKKYFYNSLEKICDRIIWPNLGC